MYSSESLLLYKYIKNMYVWKKHFLLPFLTRKSLQQCYYFHSKSVMMPFSQGRSWNFENGTLSFSALSDSKMLLHNCQLICFEHQGKVIWFLHLQIFWAQGFNKLEKLLKVPCIYNSTHLLLQCSDSNLSCKDNLIFPKLFDKDYCTRLLPYPPFWSHWLISIAVFKVF